jgi:hypothetical protein
VTGFRQSEIGRIQLDLDPDSLPFKPGETRFDAPTLQRFLNASSDSVGLVLIDTPIPPDASEANRQAMLRNLFCAQLFELGACRGVLAIGLFRYGHASKVFQQMAARLKLGPSLAELHRLLMTNASGAVVPPALWTDDPDLPVN